MATAQQQAQQARVGAGARPTVSAQLQQMIASRGITPSQNTATEDDDDDPAVFVGYSKRTAVASPGQANSGKNVQGIQTKSLKTLQKEFYGMSRGDLIKLQGRLEASGMLQPKKYQKGVHDEATMDAYTTLLTRAARYLSAGQHMSPDDVLKEGESNPLEIERDPFNPKVTNPEDLKSVIGKAASLVVGHSLDDKTVNSLVAQYQQSEIDSQKQEYDLIAAGKDGTITDPMKADTFASQQVRAKDPMGAAVLDVQDRAAAVASMAKGFDPSNIGRGSQ